jgi:hypothetical protein
MSLEFAGFKSKVLMGKNDVVSNFVSKIPQANNIVFEYIREPYVPSSSPVPNEVRQTIDEIIQSTKIISLDKQKYSKTVSKVTPAVIETPEIGEIGL